MHPVLFHFSSILIPAYGAATALGLLLALYLAERARIARLDSERVWKLCVVTLFAAVVSSRLLLVMLVVVGGLVVLERNGPAECGGAPPFRKVRERMGHGALEGPRAKNEAANG